MPSLIHCQFLKFYSLDQSKENSLEYHKKLYKIAVSKG